MFPGVFYALLAGFLGAVASSTAKLSLGADYLKGVCETGLRTWGEQRKFRQADETTACDRVRRRQSRILKSRTCRRASGQSRVIWLGTGIGSFPSRISSGLPQHQHHATAALSCRIRVPNDIAARAVSVCVYVFVCFFITQVVFQWRLQRKRQGSRGSCVTFRFSSHVMR